MVIIYRILVTIYKTRRIFSVPSRNCVDYLCRLCILLQNTERREILNGHVCILLLKTETFNYILWFYRFLREDGETESEKLDEIQIHLVIKVCTI